MTPAEDEELRRFHREFEPITDLRDYAFVFAQKGYASPPVIWLDAKVNVLAVANALRAFAEQIERAALDDPNIPDSDWEKAGRIKPRRPH